MKKSDYYLINKDVDNLIKRKRNNRESELEINDSEENISIASSSIVCENIASTSIDCDIIDENICDNSYRDSDSSASNISYECNKIQINNIANDIAEWCVECNISNVSRKRVIKSFVKIPPQSTKRH